ncbi:hypothetical protein BDV3_001351 [Batrachochytrium dendrobatidis]|uniref:sphinganine-1-phosphate aldolase n=1 Tax=Batrachochytrium dendrobatidis (strain JEL423) TaxID=403673 RepID=A0A177W9M9_BATDL|nr:Dihydrosphingosine phosphate lyase [Batrachochytrium dendrobatidis]KAK5668509.1 Dihydrosphingosine phosphate lyase [Batrachochytrium dendrobatidis]OAJ36733.1 hypothetical protein BDEG_20876 [Batrachochytrium dendrobatidis JEL423]
MSNSQVWHIQQLVTQFLRKPAMEVVKNILLLVTVYRLLKAVMRQLRAKGLVATGMHYRRLVIQSIISIVRSSSSSANALVQQQIDKTVKSIHKKMVHHAPGDKIYLRLPDKGLSERELRVELSRYKNMGDVDWEGGRVSGTIYHGGEDLCSILTEAYGMFSISNPLHPEVFPGVRQMEAEIVSMVAAMYNGSAGVCGSVTSGGTESILMAIKAYRDMAKELRGITEPEMVVPITVHAAFDKGANYFGVTIIHIAVDPKSGKVDVGKVARAINRNTILIAGSTPGFSHGIADDIPALAALAKKHKIGMHVDSCLGGFIVPFAEMAGFPLPYKTDFRVDGVTSISVDPHKYGFAPKGSSVILYKSKDIRKYQYFVQTMWPGGVYGSPSVAGSRPGALIAGCWTAMLKFGIDGYVQTTKDIIGAARRIRAGLAAIPGIRIMGDPLLTVVAFEAIHPIKTYAVADLVSRKGWHLNVLQFPASVHIACTILTVPIVDHLIADVAEAVEILQKDPTAGNGDLAAIYGTAATVDDRSIIAEVAQGFLDGLTMI